MSTIRKQALIVEDDAWIRRFMCDVLADERYGVLEAADGSSGIRLATEHSPDLVLLDLALPGVTGVDVIRSLKRSRRTRHVPVVVLSAYPRVLSSGDAQSVAQVLAKPVDVDCLLEVIQQCIVN